MRFISFAILFLSSALWAQDPDAATDVSKGYVSVHLANSETSWNEGSQDFEFVNIGGAVGYRVNDVFALDLLLSVPTSEEKDDLTSSIVGQTVDVSVSNIGAYAVLQTPTRAYLKGRLGLAITTYTYSASGFEDETERGVGASYGFGAGIKISDTVNLEIENLHFPEVDDPLYIDTSYDTQSTMLSLVWNLK